MTEIFFPRVACFRKSILPFALTLAAGLLLAGVTAPSRPSRQFSRTEAAGRQEHSKTWLVVTSLPGRAQRVERGGGLEGSVRLRVVLGEDGFVRGVRAVSVGVPGGTDEDVAALVREAEDAAGRLRFMPATADGRPVALGATVEYNCSAYDFAHTAYYGCRLSIVKVADDWRIIYE